MLATTPRPLPRAEETAPDLAVLILDVQANVLDQLSVLEAKLDALQATLEALVTSAAEASAMAQSVMSGGLRSLLSGGGK